MKSCENCKFEQICKCRALLWCNDSMWTNFGIQLFEIYAAIGCICRLHEPKPEESNERAF